jgi:cold shock protein
VVQRDQGLWLHRAGEGADVFVHHASIIGEGFKTLSEGDRVSFDVEAGPKGLVAKNVVKIS